MAVREGTVCEIKALLRACGDTAIGQCVYCGRPFCQRHGVTGEDGEEVCSRKNCVAKKEDLVRHLVYKEGVLRRNRQRLCGLENCQNSFTGQCSRCKLYYCGRHRFPGSEQVFDGQVRIDRPAMLCRHCQQRRPIWLRD
jgi:hypothetical protein